LFNERLLNVNTTSIVKLKCNDTAFLIIKCVFFHIVHQLMYRQIPFYEVMLPRKKIP